MDSEDYLFIEINETEDSFTIPRPIGNMFEGKKILITGGTGSLGTVLTKRLLQTNVETIRIYSRDELKQSQMESAFNDRRLRFLIGDIRDIYNNDLGLLREGKILL